MLKKLLASFKQSERSLRQRTLKNTIKATGVGLYSGKKVYITLKPAPEDTGIIFRRLDLPEIPEIPAKVENMSNSPLFTTLEKNNTKVSSVEHLLSAMAGMGIDNAYIELTGEEVPAMDGSAGPFVFLLQSADVFEQAFNKKFIRIKKNILIEEGEKWVRLEPYEGFKIALSLDFERSSQHHIFQNVTIDFSETSYMREVSRARNFELFSRLEKQKAKRIKTGISLNNTIMIGDNRIFNEDGYRYEDELIRHKVVDAIGDLKLLENDMLGAFFSGNNIDHRLTQLLLQKLLADKTAWEIVSI